MAGFDFGFGSELKDAWIKFPIVETVPIDHADESEWESDDEAQENAPEAAIELSQGPPIEDKETTASLPADNRTPSSRRRRVSTPRPSKSESFVFVRELTSPEREDIEETEVVPSNAQNPQPNCEAALSPRSALEQKSGRDCPKELSIENPIVLEGIYKAVDADSAKEDLLANSHSNAIADNAGDSAFSQLGDVSRMQSLRALTQVFRLSFRMISLWTQLANFRKLNLQYLWRNRIVPVARRKVIYQRYQRKVLLNHHTRRSMRMLLQLCLPRRLALGRDLAMIQIY